MTATVTPIRPAADPDTPAVARWLARRGWSALDAFHAGLPADLCAAVLIAEITEASPS